MITAENTNNTAGDGRLSHKYAEESECRVLLGRPGLRSGDDILSALRSELSVRKIKDYAFVDTYFRPVSYGDGYGPDVNLGSTRLREWTSYVLQDGTVKPSFVQIINSYSEIHAYNGIPFKYGTKKSKSDEQSVQSAQAKLNSDGLVTWFQVAKENGMHCEIGDGAVTTKIAIEDVICRHQKASWSGKMAEFEVLSMDRDLVVREYERIFSILGIRGEEVIGDTMAKIALRKLNLE